MDENSALPFMLSLQAAPMDKEEIEDLIKKCFEADNNGEINFLSFWSGQHLIFLS